MWFHRDIDKYAGYNIYSMKKYVNRKRIILITVLIVLIFIMLAISIFYIAETIKINKREKAFTNQLVEFTQKIQNEEQQKEKEEKEQKGKKPQLTDKGRENLKNIYHGDDKIAYLTFDDGPSNNTSKILDILNQYNIKATFFVLGAQVKIFPETTNRMYNEGHYIANHGYSHKYQTIYQSPEQVLNEFNQCNQIVAQTINVPEYNSHLFRFPGGSVGGKYASIKSQAATLLSQNNILYIDWNSLTGDAQKQDLTEDYLMENLKNTTANKNHIVVLMHDAQAKIKTVEVLPKVIEYLKQQGYSFQNFYSIII